MTSSRITPIQAASDGEDTAGRQAKREHGLAGLRGREAKALISLASEALSETHKPGPRDALRYLRPGRRYPECRAARPARGGAGLHGDGRALPAHARQRRRRTAPNRPAAAGPLPLTRRCRAWRAPTLQPGQPHDNPPETHRERGEWR